MILAVAIGAALIKGITGMGYPIILVPLAALLVPTEDAIVFVTISNFVLNLALAWMARDDRGDSKLLTTFVGSAIVGGVVGAAILPSLPDAAIRLMLIGIVIAFLINRYRSPTWEIPPDKRATLTPLVGGVAGLFQGAGGISGPVVAPWFLSLKQSRDAYVFATTVTYALSGLAQIVVFGVQGTYTPRLFTIALLLVPFTLAVQPIGVRLRQRINMDTFERLVLGILVFAMLSLAIRLVV